MSERQQLSATVHGKLETLSRVDASKKLVRSGLGELDFEPGVPVLETTVDLFKDLHSLDSNILPLAMLRRIDQRGRRHPQHAPGDRGLRPETVEPRRNACRLASTARE